MIFALIKHQTSNIKHQTSNIKHQTSNIKHQTSNIKHQTSNIKHQTSNIKHQTSNIKHQTEIYHPKNPTAWRKWLQKNHASKDSVWLVFYNKASAKPTISWSEAVDEALCFGWIDSKKISIDHESSHQFFSRRKAGSTWSKINKEKVVRLIAEGKMTDAGASSIETARQNGSWMILDTVEALIIPIDLEKAFKTHKGSKDFFLSLSKSAKKMILQWLVLAKRPETRQNRLTEIASLAAQKLKPKQFR